MSVFCFTSFDIDHKFTFSSSEKIRFLMYLCGNLFYPMEYTELKLIVNEDTQQREALMAYLADLDYESFSEENDVLLAYIPTSSFDEKKITELRKQLESFIPFQYSHRRIAEQNWNAVWEENYQSVTIDRVHIRAPFHEKNPLAKYDVLIEPKMSFGTAHHPTTALMIKYLMELDLNQKVVLDMGCGTAVLAILASMLQAKHIDAVDNDEWAYQNAIENVKRNNLNNIAVFMDDARFLMDKSECYDIIIANINRNILLQDIATYAAALRPGSCLLLSGFYTQDLPLLVLEAEKHGLSLQNQKVEQNWCAALLIK